MVPKEMRFWLFDPLFDWLNPERCNESSKLDTRMELDLVFLGLLLQLLLPLLMLTVPSSRFLPDRALLSSTTLDWRVRRNRPNTMLLSPQRYSL